MQAWVPDLRLRDHGIEPSCDVEESRAQTATFKRIRELERENKTLREDVAYLLQVNLKFGGHHPKMTYPLVRNLAAAWAR